MDDDTIPNNDSLSKLLEVASKLNNNFSFLSSKVLWTDGSLCNMNLQIMYEKVNEFFINVKFGAVPVKKASFVSFFANCDVVREVGLPIKEFFIYGDDWEYSLRMNRRKPSYYIENSVVIHKMKTNSGAGIITCDQDRIDRCYYNIRNSFYIERKYENRKKQLKYFLNTFFSIFRIINKSPNKKIKRCLVLMKGLLDGFRFNPPICYK